MLVEPCLSDAAVMLSQTGVKGAAQLSYLPFNQRRDAVHETAIKHASRVMTAELRQPIMVRGEEDMSSPVEWGSDGARWQHALRASIRRCG